MNKIQVAIVTLGDCRREFYQKRENIAREEQEKIQKEFGEKYNLYFSPVVFDGEDGQEVADEIRRQGIRAVILHIPIWATPSLSVRPAFAVDGPVLLLGNKRRDSSSLVALLAVAGMLEQSGKTCIRVCGEFANPEIKAQVDTYVSACSVTQALGRSSFGMVGGRSIGIGTTVADPAQWQKLFGVESDHTDQYEIVYRTKSLDPERVKRHLEWVKKNFAIGYGENFNQEQLKMQVESYLALKDIAEEKGYDFMGIKCQQEMSDHFVLQCLGVALMNNDCDGDGPKQPVPVSCECDCDGALTMRLLSLCAGGTPSCLMDIKFFDGDTREFILANCGAAAPYFAAPGAGAAACGKVTLLPHIFGLAGGGALQFISEPGDVTVARLYRQNGEYVLACFEGKTEMRPLEELRKTTWCYPHAFIKADVDYQLFFNTINSNHLHFVYGKYNAVLKLFCQMTGIRYICYNR